MTSFRDFAKSVCSELPTATYVRWASALFSLSVLTFLLSLAAAQAFLALAALAYVVHLWRNRLTVHFPPIMVPLALFCLFTLLSTWKAANPGAGGFAVRKLVLFTILLFTANLVSSARRADDSCASLAGRGPGQHRAGLPALSSIWTGSARGLS